MQTIREEDPTRLSSDQPDLPRRHRDDRRQGAREGQDAALRLGRGTGRGHPAISDGRADHRAAGERHVPAAEVRAPPQGAGRRQSRRCSSCWSRASSSAPGRRQRATAAQRLAVAAEARVVKERDEATRERAIAPWRAQELAQRGNGIRRSPRSSAPIPKPPRRRAVNEFLQRDLLAQASARAQASPDTKPDPDLKVRTALDRAAARIGATFAGQPLVEASIRQTIGSAYQDLGLYPEARQQLERALDLRRKSTRRARSCDAGSAQRPRRS